MSRRNNKKAATQAETADLDSASSKAASSRSSSAPTHATRGASTALLAKDSATYESQLVAQGWDSALFLRFRHSRFLTPPAVDDMPPSNQLETQQLVVHDTMPLGPPGGIQLPEVTLSHGKLLVPPKGY